MRQRWSCWCQDAAVEEFGVGEISQLLGLMEHSDVDATLHVYLLRVVPLMLEQEHEHLRVALHGQVAGLALQEVVVVLLGILGRLGECRIAVHPVQRLLPGYAGLSARRPDRSQPTHRFEPRYRPVGYFGYKCFGRHELTFLERILSVSSRG
jgi:hypothetical protein